MITGDAIFSHRDSPCAIHSTADLKGILLTRLGFSYPWLEAWLEQGSLTLVPAPGSSDCSVPQWGLFCGAVNNLHAGYWVLKNNPTWEMPSTKPPFASGR